jgi:hypothetical protein
MNSADNSRMAALDAVPTPGPTLHASKAFIPIKIATGDPPATPPSTNTPTPHTSRLLPESFGQSPYTPPSSRISVIKVEDDDPFLDNQRSAPRQSLVIHINELSVDDDNLEKWILAPSLDRMRTVLQQLRDSKAETCALRTENERLKREINVLTRRIDTIEESFETFVAKYTM